MVSSNSSSGVPEYQGIDAVGSTILSPRSAETGTQRTSGTPSWPMKSSHSRRIRSKVSCFEAYEIHLVHGDDDVPNAHERHDVAMAAGLHLHAARGVDEDNGEMRGRRARSHVARVLLVTGRIGDDELAPVGIEEAVGHVDRDALLAFGLESVDEQG